MVENHNSQNSEESYNQEEENIPKEFEIHSEENNSKLNRESLLENKNPKKNYGILVLFILGVMAVGWFVTNHGGKKTKDELTQENEKFEPAGKRSTTANPETKPSYSPPPDKTLSEEEMAKLKQAEAFKQARLKSGIVIYQGGSVSKATASSEEKEIPSSNNGGPSTLSDSNSRFQQTTQTSSFPQSKAASLGNLETIVLQGKLIDAVLETAVNSDLPGMVRAIVSYDLYAESGNQVLIPRGSRLIGQYNSEIRKGQARLFIIWNRLIRPDGIEIAINSGGTDPLGQAGIKGHVNNHFWQIFGTSTLLSILGAGSANFGASPTDQYNSLSAYREQLTQSFQASSSKILEQYADIPPTITIKQGTPIKVFVARDLNFSEALAALYPTQQMTLVP